MSGTLPDLRVTIAESMEALAARHHLRQGQINTRAAHIAQAGAETLRWCAEREAPTAENDHTIEDLVANVRFAVSKWEHGDECPAGQLEARGDAVCNCALVERRKGVLDAVA